jgi:hypothetical protein
MNDSDRRSYEKFVRVRDFGQGRLSDFASTSLGHQYFTDIATVVNDFNAHAAAEASARSDARQGTDRREQARNALRDALEDIARTARALIDEVPGIAEKFRVPRNNSDKDLLNAGRTFKQDAEPIKAHFIAHEMPADFLDNLQDDIDALEAAISSQSTGVGGQVAAGAALDAIIARGNNLVRKLDVIVRNKYANDPATLAEWTSASHTERAPRRSKKTPSAPTPTV